MKCLSANGKRDVARLTQRSVYQPTSPTKAKKFRTLKEDPELCLTPGAIYRIKTSAKKIEITVKMPPGMNLKFDGLPGEYFPPKHDIAEEVAKRFEDIIHYSLSEAIHSCLRQSGHTDKLPPGYLRLAKTKKEKEMMKLFYKMTETLEKKT